MRNTVLILLTLLALNCQNSPLPLVDGPLSAELHFKINSINKFSQVHHAALEIYLATSPNWSLRQAADGELYALRRPIWQGKYYATADDFFAISDNFQERGNIKVRLSTKAAVVKQPEHVTLVHGSVKNVRLRLRPVNKGKLQESVFIIAGPSLTLTVSERSGDSQRKFTEEAVKEVISELKRVVDSQFGVKNDGYLREPFVFRFPRNLSTPKIVDESQSGLQFSEVWRIESWPAPAGGTVLDVFCNRQVQVLPKFFTGTCQDNSYQVLALVNAKQAGELAVRLRYAGTGKFLSGKEFISSAPERAGFLKEADQRFALVATFKLTDALTMPSSQIGVELWFRAENGQAPRRLAMQLIDVEREKNANPIFE
jgi:hypothetical protein